MLTILSIKPDVFTHTHTQSHKYQNINNCLQFFNFSQTKNTYFFSPYFDIRMRFLIKIYNKSK